MVQWVGVKVADAKNTKKKIEMRYIQVIRFKLNIKFEIYRKYCFNFCDFSKTKVAQKTNFQKKVNRQGNHPYHPFLLAINQTCN